MQVAVVDDVEEDVSGVRAIAEIADLVDDEHVGMRVGRQRVPEAAPAGGQRELGDERRRRGERGIEAILNRAVLRVNL
jgi:hypothetical protein